MRSETILDVLGADALRYFLFREVAFGQDGSFSFDALVQRYNADLANDLGNLASRTLAMITKYYQGEVPYPEVSLSRTNGDLAIERLGEETIASFNTLWEEYQFARALEAAWSLVGAVNKYIVENEPWALADKHDPESRARLGTVLYTCAEALRVVTVLAHPVIPESTARIWSQLGLRDLENYDLRELKWGQLTFGTKLGAVQPVFPRADKSAIERMQKLEQEPAVPPAAEAAKASATTENKSAEKASGAASAPAAAAGAAPSQAAASAPAGDKISIDDFVKVELRVAQVKVAEKVKGADKLLRLEVDLGDHTRQIVAGIAEAYSPESLVGRKIVIVANLQPRKLRGLESNGMLLAASLPDGKPVLASFLEEVPVGARLK